MIKSLWFIKIYFEFGIKLERKSWSSTSELKAANRTLSGSWFNWVESLQTVDYDLPFYKPFTIRTRSSTLELHLSIKLRSACHDNEIDYSNYLVIRIIRKCKLYSKVFYIFDQWSYKVVRSFFKLWVSWEWMASIIIDFIIMKSNLTHTHTFTNVRLNPT